MDVEKLVTIVYLVRWHYLRGASPAVKEMAPNGLLVLDAPLHFDLSGCRLNQGADAWGKGECNGCVPFAGGHGQGELDAKLTIHYPSINLNFLF